MNQYFDRIYCLNQDSRPDRWQQAQEEFARIGMQVERFASIPADQPYKSFCLSQYGMLRQFLSSSSDTLLALEDDVVFRNPEFLQLSIDALPANWDILYLGANITEGVFGIKENPPTKCDWTNKLYRVRRAWTSHAIAYRRPVIETIVREYPVTEYQMYDDWLSRNILDRHNCYVVNPMIAWQRPGISDLWGHMADYTGAFEWGNKMMAQ
jgi:hypothetical protein